MRHVCENERNHLVEQAAMKDTFCGTISHFVTCRLECETITYLSVSLTKSGVRNH